MEQAFKKKRGRPSHESHSEEFIEKKRNIITTAAQVFRMHGYEGGTLNDVAAEIGTTKASLYHYVKNKEELLYEIINLSMDRILVELENLEKIQDPVERLKEMIRQHVVLIISEKDMFAVYFEQTAKLQSVYFQEIREKEKKYVGIFKKTLNEIMTIGKLPNVYLSFAVHIILGMCNWSYKWFDENEALSSQKLAENIISLLHL